jgi:hypothetical protein
MCVGENGCVRGGHFLGHVTALFRTCYILSCSLRRADMREHTKHTVPDRHANGVARDASNIRVIEQHLLLGHPDRPPDEVASEVLKEFKTHGRHTVFVRCAVIPHLTFRWSRSPPFFLSVIECIYVSRTRGVRLLPCPAEQES